MLDIARKLLLEEHEERDEAFYNKLQQLKNVLEMLVSCVCVLLHYNTLCVCVCLLSLSTLGMIIFLGLIEKFNLNFFTRTSTTFPYQVRRCNGFINIALLIIGPALLLIAKWGGEVTPAGERVAEEFGKAFRCMYPGGEGEYSLLPGSGFLRLHSTYRHDLKVWINCL